MDDINANDDTNALKKCMFVCQHESDDQRMAIKFKKLGWTDKDSYKKLDGDIFGVPFCAAFPLVCRVLSCSDILEHIVLNLSNEVLLNCRLVCKHWAVEMGHFISKRKSLLIIGGQCANAENMITKRENGHPIAISKLGLFDVNASAKLYKKVFHVFGYTLSIVSLEACNLSPSDLKQMLLVDAPNIESLHYREEYYRIRQPSVNVDTFKEIRRLNSGNLYLPKMKLLHWDEYNSQTELKEFIQACPNLVTLELRNFPLPNSKEYKNLKWETLRTMFLSPKDVLDSEHCEALSYLHLKLEKLTLFGLNSSDRKTMKSLSKFLSTLAEGLEVLEMWLDYSTILANHAPVHHSPLTVPLPKVLRLHTEAEILGHVKNLRKLPAITDLEIVSNQHEMQNWTTLTKRATVTPQSDSLQSFRCGDIDLKSLGKIMKLFPSITSLNIYASHVDDKLLRAVFTHLTLLVELTISPCMKTNLLRVTDSGITGISASNCAKLRKNLSNYDDSRVMEWQSEPSIDKLQCLQKLDLSLSVSDKMTDVSVLFGISRLTKLNTLKLPICKVTDGSISVIGHKMEKLIILGLAGCTKVTSKAIEDFKAQRGCVIIDFYLPPDLQQRS